MSLSLTYIVTQQFVAYFLKCDLCGAGNVGYTKGHLHTRIEGHREKASSVHKHYSKTLIMAQDAPKR